VKSIIWKLFPLFGRFRFLLLLLPKHSR